MDFGNYSSTQTWNFFLLSATKLGQGYVFTWVCDSLHRGMVSAGACWDTPPQGGETPLEQTPPTPRKTPGRHGKTHTPPRKTPPGRQSTTPGSSACWEIRATSGRTVRMLLECILVWNIVCVNFYFRKKSGSKILFSFKHISATLSAIVVYIWKFHSFISVEWISESLDETPVFQRSYRNCSDSIMIYGK